MTSQTTKTGGVTMAKNHKNNNKVKNSKSRLETASEISPDIKSCNNENCVSKGPCKTNNCK